MHPALSAFFCFSYIGVYFFREDLPKLIANYWADFIFIPILLSVIRYTLVWIKNNRTLRIQPIQALTVFLIVSVCMELIFPMYHAVHTADPWDVVAYLLGTLFYLRFQQPYFPSLG